MIATFKYDLIIYLSKYLAFVQFKDSRRAQGCNECRLPMILGVHFQHVPHHLDNSPTQQDPQIIHSQTSTSLTQRLKKSHSSCKRRVSYIVMVKFSLNPFLSLILDLMFQIFNKSHIDNQ